MAGALQSIAGLGGYVDARNQDMAERSAQIQQVGALQAMAAKMREQQQLVNFRDELAAAPTPEAKAAIAEKYGTPKDILGHADTQARIASTKEIAFQRLTQTAQLAAQKATTADQKAAVDKWYKQGVLAIQQGRAAFELPPDLVPAAVPAPGASPVPVAGPVAAPVGPWAAQGPIKFSDMSPEDQAKATAMGFKNSASPIAAPAALPVAAPEQPQAMPTDAGNLDARDLRARTKTLAGIASQQAPVAEPAAPAAPAAPVKPPEYATWSRKQQADYDAKAATAQNKASIAGAGVPSKDTATFVARQYLNGNDQAITGYARSVPAKLVLMDAIRTEAEKQGLSPEAVNAKIAEFQGTKAASRTIGTRSAGIAMAAEEAQQAIQIVKDTSANFNRTNFVPWNYALKAYDTNTGRPEVVEFGAAINALVNTYARALSPTGVPHQADKDHAREILSTINSPDQVDGVLKIIDRELNIAKRAPAAVRDQIRRDVTGGNGGGKSKADEFFR